jgi:hypothetical protein
MNEGAVLGLVFNRYNSNVDATPWLKIDLLGLYPSGALV